MTVVIFDSCKKLMFIKSKVDEKNPIFKILFARKARSFEQFSDQDAEPDFNLFHP
jgi:hypothetical protein